MPEEGGSVISDYFSSDQWAYKGSYTCTKMTTCKLLSVYHSFFSFSWLRMMSPFSQNDRESVLTNKDDALKSKNTASGVKHSSGNMMLHGCFAASGTATMKTDYLQIHQL